MNAIELISQDLFDKIRSRFANLELGDENGNVTTDPRQARFFDFNFSINGNNLGRVTISINERGALKMFYGQGILEETDPITQEMWFDFLKDMRNFAKRRLLRYDTRDITRSNLKKSDFQYLASTGSKEDNMAESKMFGSKKSSYLPLEKTRLIVRHSKSVDESSRGSRSRNISAIFVENAIGERFKFPINYLPGAKAMQRHVANGGSPHDLAGSEIVSVCENIKNLSKFKKSVDSSQLKEEAASIFDKIGVKLDSLKEHISNLSKQKYYDSWRTAGVYSESAANELDQLTIEDYKTKFTINSFSEDLTQYFPLIHSIMQEDCTIDLSDYVKPLKIKESFKKSPTSSSKTKVVREFAEFTKWVGSINESSLEADVIASLKDLFAGEITLGVDAIDAIESLEGIGIKDSGLNAALKSLAKVNPEADPIPTITAWLEKADPAAAEEIVNGNQEPGAGLTPANPEEAPPAEEPPSEEPPPDEQAPPPADQQQQEQPPAEESAKKSKPKLGSANQAMLPEGVSLLKVAELVKSFYDRKTKKFPLGKTGVITKVRKEYGDKAAELADKLISNLTGETESSAPKEPNSNEPTGSDKMLYGEDLQLESIKKLAGI